MEKIERERENWCKCVQEEGANVKTTFDISAVRNFGSLAVR